MKKFVSLRSKILVGFTLMFTVFSVGVYYWFYRFTTEKTLQRLKDDLQTMAVASSQQIDVKELMALSEEAKATPEGRSNDLRYQNQLQWLIQKHEINPKIFLFTFTKNSSWQDEKKIIYLVDVWMNINPSKSVHFLESNFATPYHINTLTKGSIEFRDAYKDRWGEWITYYAPIRDESGAIVAGIGADMQIDDIRRLQAEIRRQFLISFGISYPLLLTLIYILSTLLTRRFKAMQKYAQEVGNGNYQPDVSLTDDLQLSFFSDERIILSKALEEMTEKIRYREELLNGIFNQVAVGIAIFSPEYKFEIVNQTLCHLLGYSETELLKKDCWSITFPEDIEITRQYAEEIINSSVSSPPPHEKRCIHKNGEIKWCEIAFTH
ncbi:PAS domain S-box protein [Geminocystis sp. CENA526]|uniref:PAS domain S-box protein n=1 Tax=Geminocystis sp. CENA526 TaxID=1355871 RepID=UPI003D6F4953